jgi:hypothetical protein
LLKVPRPGVTLISTIGPTAKMRWGASAIYSRKNNFEVIKSALWWFGNSHDFGRCQVTMFLAIPSRYCKNLTPEQLKLYNVISVLPISAANASPWTWSTFAVKCPKSRRRIDFPDAAECEIVTDAKVPNPALTILTLKVWKICNAISKLPILAVVAPP